MKPFLKFVAFVLLAGILFYVSCKKEYSCENCGSNPPSGSTNKFPIAVAGPDQIIALPTDSVSLDGSLSSDPDGRISGYLWTKISGPASFNIIKPTDSTTKVKVLVTGTYKFELKVTDNGGLSAKDTVQIIVNDPSQPNHPPVANAGADQTITLPNNTVTLDGSGSTDPDNNITNYQWTKISGPSSLSISNPNAVQTQVTNLVQGTNQFELKVIDAGGLLSRDTMQVTVNAEQPDPCAANRPLINAQLIQLGTLTNSNGGFSMASAGNKIVFAGGFGIQSGIGEATSRVDIYDIVTQNWSTAELSVARMGMTVVVSGSKIFFAGGWDTDEIAFYAEYNNVDIYDASTNTWSVDTLSLPRSFMTGAAVGNKVLFAGGASYGYPKNIIDIYDIATHSWSVAALSSARWHFTAGTVNNKVFFAGGYSSNPFGASGVVDIYDNTTNSWSATTLSEPRDDISVNTIDNKIYFAGGSNSQTVSNKIDIYNNSSNTWTVNTLHQPRAAITSIADGDKIYWAGGSLTTTTLPYSQFSNEVEIKDINTQTSTLACLFQPNVAFQAVKKNNQIVFFTGAGTVKNKFDIYDILNKSWSIGVLNENIPGAEIISINNTIYVVGQNVNTPHSTQLWKLEF